MAKKNVRKDGPHKKHGPKRKQFSAYGKVGSMQMSKAGVLNKFTDISCWRMACADRGIRDTSEGAWESFSKLSEEDKRKFFSKK